jgi:hypothetical protein
VDGAMKLCWGYIWGYKFEDTRLHLIFMSLRKMYSDETPASSKSGAYRNREIGNGETFRHFYVFSRLP